MLSTSVNPAIALKAKLFRGFADPSRLAILEVLQEGPRAVGEIVDVTELGQSNVSNHLACLRDCGLVTSEKRGKYVYYQLSDPRIGQLLELAEAVLADVAQEVYACTRYKEA